MKTIATSAVLAVAFTGMFAGAARSQERVVVTVPFPFVVHGEELPAGHYDISSRRRCTLDPRDRQQHQDVRADAAG